MREEGCREAYVAYEAYEAYLIREEMVSTRWKGKISETQEYISKESGAMVLSITGQF